jgi:tetratricopeptide (TPR) repeat protein
MYRIRSLLLVPVLLGLFAAPASRVRAEEEAPKKLYLQTLHATAYVKVRDGSGTGWIVDRDRRLLVTNYHVVEGFDRADVTFPTFKDGRLLVNAKDYKGKAGVSATVVDVDPERDLAILQVDVLPEGTTALQLAKVSADVMDRIHSIGNPGASDALWVYTQGTVRQVYQKEWTTRPRKTLLHHKAYILEAQAPNNPGDSGGPVVNDQGELVGVVTGGMVYQNGEPVNLMGYNIDVREVRAFLTQTCRLLEPKTAEDLALRGERLTKRGLYDEAFDAFSAALKLDKDCQAVYRNRGKAFLSKGDYDTAIADLDVALKLDPTDAVAYNWRANSYYFKAKGDKEAPEFTKALADYTRAIQYNPKYALAYNNRGVLHDIKGEQKEALADYSRAIDNDPGYARCLLNRGDLYRSWGEYQKALQDYGQALKVELTPQGLLGVAQVYYDQKKDDEVVRICTLSIQKVDPDYAPSYAFRGAALAGQGKYELAVADYDKAITLNPRYAWVYYLRGEAQEALGNAGPSAVDYEKAVSLDKSYADQVKVQTTRYLKVVNKRDEPIRVYLLYETRTNDGNWSWFPSKPGEGAPLYVDIDPGKETYILVDGWKVKGRTVRIWGVGKKSGTTWETNKDKDLALVPQGGYRAHKETDFTYTYNK